MILPGSHLISLLLLILTLVCWGSWANTLKATDKAWRFELYYFDFAIGVFLAALAAALTLGTFGWDGFSFLDDLVLAGKRQDVFALGAGVVFNLGNMLIVAALSLAGMSLAFPAGLGVALAVGAIWSSFVGPTGNFALRFGGSSLMIVAAVLATIAYRATTMATLMETVKTGKSKSTRKSVNMKAVGLAVIGGVFAGSYYPLLQAGRDSEIGLGPYSVGFMFALGILISTFIFNLFFMNLPVQGEPVDMVDYFKARAGTHIAGMLGGILWYAGTLAVFIGDKVTGAASVGPVLSYALPQAGIILAVLWGIALWKERASADARVNYYVVVMLVVLVGGVALLSFGQIAPGA